MSKPTDSRLNLMFNLSRVLKDFVFLMDFFSLAKISVSSDMEGKTAYNLCCLKTKHMDRNVVDILIGILQNISRYVLLSRRNGGTVWGFRHPAPLNTAKCNKIFQDL